jgi:hypothetical protein
MLRSLGLFLLLATAALAQDGVHRGYEYTVTLMREGHDNEDCYAADVFIQAQMQTSASNATGGLYNHPLYRAGAGPLNRKLRIGATPRELGWCNENCRCQTVEMCHMGGFCADSCPNCACGRRAQDTDAAGEDFEKRNADILAVVGPALVQLAQNFQVAWDTPNNCLGNHDKLEVVVSAY